MPLWTKKQEIDFRREQERLWVKRGKTYANEKRWNDAAEAYHQADVSRAVRATLEKLTR